MVAGGLSGTPSVDADANAAEARHSCLSSFEFS